MSSIGLFDTSTQANESTRVASERVRDEKLERILQTPPKPSVCRLAGEGENLLGP